MNYSVLIQSLLLVIFRERNDDLFQGRINNLFFSYLPDRNYTLFFHFNLTDKFLFTDQIRRHYRHIDEAIKHVLLRLEEKNTIEIFIHSLTQLIQVLYSLSFEEEQKLNM